MHQVHFNNTLQLSTKSFKVLYQAVYCILFSFTSFMLNVVSIAFSIQLLQLRMITKHFLHPNVWNVSYTPLPAEELIFFDYCGMPDRRVKFPVTTVLHLKED